VLDEHLRVVVEVFRCGNPSSEQAGATIVERIAVRRLAVPEEPLAKYVANVTSMFGECFLQFR
jgi:hypothetical protein